MNCIDYSFKELVDKDGKAIFSKQELGEMLRAMTNIANSTPNKLEAIEKINKYSQIKTLLRQKELQEKFDNAEKRLRIENKIASYADQKVAKPELEAAIAMIEGSNVPGQGAKYSIAGLMKSKFTYLKDMLTIDLDSRNLREFTDAKYDTYVARALFDLETTGKINPIAGLDGHTFKKISELAETYEKFNQTVIRILRGSGIYIGEIKGYLGRQLHSTEKITVAGKDAWKQGIINKLDHEKTFGEHAGNLKEMNGILDTIYKHITDGEGTYALSKFNRARQLHFKTPEDWIAYSKEFSTHDNMFDNFMSSIRGVARISSIVDVFGTNYKAELDMLRNRLKPAERTKFDDMVHAMYGFDEFAGSSQLAKNGATVRAVMNSAKLMNTIFQAFNDNVTMGLAIKHASGEWMPTAWARAMFQTVTDLVPTEGRKKFLSGLGVDSEFSHNMFLSRIIGDEQFGTGLAAKLNNWTYSWNFTRHWTAAAKHTMAKNVLGAMDELLTKNSLDARDMNFLSQYDITKKDLDSLRDIASKNKGKSLSIDLILQSNDSGFYYKDADATNNSARLAFKLSNMISQIADMGVPTPGKKESRQLFRLEDPDTLRGQVVRFLTQFKLTPMKQANTMMFMARLEGGGFPIGWMIGRTAAMGFASYWLADSVKKYMRGDETWAKDLTEYEPTEMFSYMVRGGGFGLMADMVATTMDNQYLGLKSAVGPAASGLVDVGSMVRRASMSKDIDKPMANFILSNLPGVNHPFSVITGIRQGMKDGMIDIFDF